MVTNASVAEGWLTEWSTLNRACFWLAGLLPGLLTFFDRGLADRSNNRWPLGHSGLFLCAFMAQTLGDNHGDSVAKHMTGHDYVL